MCERERERGCVCGCVYGWVDLVGCVRVCVCVCSCSSTLRCPVCCVCVGGCLGLGVSERERVCVCVRAFAVFCVRSTASCFALFTSTLQKNLS